MKIYHYLKYVRGIELSIMVKARSKKKVAELFGETIHAVNKYVAGGRDDRHPWAEENVVYAAVGLGGEARESFNTLSDGYFPLDQFIKAIEVYRKTIPNRESAKDGAGKAVAESWGVLKFFYEGVEVFPFEYNPLGYTEQWEVKYRVLELGQWRNKEEMYCTPQKGDENLENVRAYFTRTHRSAQIISINYQ
ncbi:hypothetical protein UFOVP1492_15 [uncultured Caudovirales phage]|uniref:Uncharacterized protein n=1 Tax=uncultured Caudovirales phage TaxID=2100421 RepID=A0A6J5R938_9CAUD|nr:hypothetical protein UFOVP1127_119 [uncultured Caudovirales phage]CAB4193499.1 hypothetical protein UFOVP1242_91 [uncultured Caudovirales phage]CAB4217205.1 hypothetical protein UFOVP1492_15 [uncultured Caudovirales phage]CAB5231252.1 hypothetical protein UFOVP1580_44 [uncultured Caudovirales phage]